MRSEKTALSNLKPQTSNLKPLTSNLSRAPSSEHDRSRRDRGTLAGCAGPGAGAALSGAHARARGGVRRTLSSTGFDTLGARIALGASNGTIRVVEIDHAATQSVKRHALAPYGLPKGGFSFVELDLTTRSLTEALSDTRDFDARAPAVFVAEGLLMYLTPGQVAAFFRELHDLAAPGSRIVFTFMESDRPDRIRFKNLSWWYAPLLDLWLRRLGEPMRWAIDRADLGQWLDPTGWTLLDIADRDTFRTRYLVPAGLATRPLADGEYVGEATMEV